MDDMNELMRLIIIVNHVHDINNTFDIMINSMLNREAINK